MRRAGAEQAAAGARAAAAGASAEAAAPEERLQGGVEPEGLQLGFRVEDDDEVARVGPAQHFVFSVQRAQHDGSDLRRGGRSFGTIAGWRGKKSSKRRPRSHPKCRAARTKFSNLGPWAWVKSDHIIPPCGSVLERPAKARV